RAQYSGASSRFTIYDYNLLFARTAPRRLASIGFVRFVPMFRTFFISAVMLCCALPALAQTNTLEADNPREEAALRLGPVYMTPRIELSEFGIDTNVFNRAGEKQKDFTFTLTPGVDLWLPIARRGLVKASADTGLVWYRELESERSVDPDFTLRGEPYLRRITLFGEFGYLRSRQR